MRPLRFHASLGLMFALLLTTFTLPAEAQMRGGAGRSMGERPRGDSPSGGPAMAERRDHEVRETGLTPVFPEHHLCEPISSPFASPFRYDGSRRRGDRNEGLHGGIDLTLREGSALLAVAGGKVIAKGAGGQLEGNYIWLLHAPSDTGLPFWMYTKYQHLAEVPELKEGDTVRVGQVVALSGRTGTIGGYYGASGYPHLHLSVFAGPSDEYTKAGAYGSMIRARGARLSDPLILYLTEIEDPAAVAALAPDRKRVRIPVVGDDGIIVPTGSKLVWPVSCRSKK